ncbi:MAG: hypothetical protein K2N67_03595, partial [Mucispirillum sp.]|nr:hypothetical protein [Mucispirillum sp.]
VGNDDFFYSLGFRYAAPVLFIYVWHILLDARKRGARAVYFLARDGHILIKIADILMKKFSLDIELRYLYCSRKSLRIPTYNFIGDETFEYLFAYPVKASAKVLLDRIELNKNEREQVYKSISFDIEREEDILDIKSFRSLCGELYKSDVYHNFINEKSSFAYGSAIKYLEQEGLLESDKIFIADSGWACSVQRSLRQLLKSRGATPNITGYYFGLVNEPKNELDGEYLAWYFDTKKGFSERALFNINVYESICAAPYGMTKGYIEKNGKIEPVFSDNEDKERIEQINSQNKGIEDFSRKAAEVIDFHNFNEKYLRAVTKKILTPVMAKPSRRFVLSLGQVSHCDDTADSYKIPLAVKEQRKYLKYYNILWRGFYKIFKRPFPKGFQEIYWPYGVSSFLPAIPRVYNRLNIYLFGLIKAYKKTA